MCSRSVDEVVEKVIEFLRSIKGIEYVKLLSNEERKVVLEVEEEAMRRFSLRPGVNIGVKKALSTMFTVACITNIDFVWPKRGVVLFIYRGVVVGEEVWDKEVVEELRRKGNKVIGNFIVFYSDKLKELGVDVPQCLRESTIVVNPLDLPWIREIPYVKNVVVASPSRKTDLVIKSLLKYETSGDDKGTILVGFDVDTS